MRSTSPSTPTTTTPRRSARLWLLAGVTIGAVALLALLFALISHTGTARQQTAMTFQAGTTLTHEPVMPDFSLLDQNGQRVTTAQLRGHVVAVTFLDAVCTQACPLTVTYLNQVAQTLGPQQTSQVMWIAISVNPSNTPAQASAFLAKYHAVPTVHFLLGTPSQLQPLWSAFHQYVQLASQPGQQDTVHSVNTFLVDTQGREREVLDQSYDPRAFAGDIARLLVANVR